jgi:DNA helicase TIP49 (TBP-interacting protein)
MWLCIRLQGCHEHTHAHRETVNEQVERERERAHLMACLLKSDEIKQIDMECYGTRCTNQCAPHGKEMRDVYLTMTL